MKSWKTTLAGLISGGSIALYAIVQAAQSGAFTGQTGTKLLGGIALIVLGALAKDHDVTGGVKTLIIGFCLMSLSTASSAQSPFKPIPKVAVARAANSFVRAATVQQDSSINAWRIITVAAAYSEPGNILMAGVGYGYQHLSWDYTSQKWVCKWSVSPVAFAGGSVAPSTPASVMSVGILGGINNNLIMAGPVYNFGTKQFGVALSIGISFNN